jgi:hypothetical protein
MCEIITPEPGIYKDVPFEEYLSWEAVNNSILRIIAKKSPAHALEEIINPSKPTDAMFFGTALHTMLLEPKLFDDRYVVMPRCDRRTKEGKKIYAEFLEKSEGKELLTEDDLAAIKGIAKSVSDNDALPFVRGGAFEVCIVWIDDRTGLKCKARLDHISDEYRIITDVKTTKDASPDDFARSIFFYDYYQQAAFYSEGWRALTGEEMSYVILACEKVPPYAMAVYQMHEDILFAGKNAWQRALKTYAQCVATKEWPAYYTGPQIINLPKWALEKVGVGPHELRPD